MFVTAIPFLEACSASYKILLRGNLPPSSFTLKSYAAFHPPTAPGTVKAANDPLVGIALKPFLL